MAELQKRWETPLELVSGMSILGDEDVLLSDGVHLGDHGQIVYARNFEPVLAKALGLGG